MVDCVNSINLSLSLSRRLAGQSNNEFNITMSINCKFHVVAIQSLCHAIISEKEEEEEGSDRDGMATIIFPILWCHCTIIQEIKNLNSNLCQTEALVLDHSPYMSLVLYNGDNSCPTLYITHHNYHKESCFVKPLPAFLHCPNLGCDSVPIPSRMCT